MSVVVTILKWLMLSIFVFCVGIFLLFYFGTVSNQVTEGEAYGFSIGMNKKQVYAAAKSQYADKAVYMRELKNNNVEYPKSHTQLEFSAYQFHQIENRDRWEIYFKKHYRDLLRLTFRDGKLASIYRGRQLMEFP